MNSAHSSTIDNVVLVGNTLVTTGKTSEEDAVKVWSVPEQGAGGEATEVCAIEGPGEEGGDMIEIWNQARLVGFDVYSGGMLAMSQDGVVNVWSLGSADGGGGAAAVEEEGDGWGAVSAAALKRIKQKRARFG